uniref:integrase core domain-containing protein n=1 Tax=Corynebacterium macginleyi TaxID=38290 RepID=UPI00398B8CC7
MGQFTQAFRNYCSSLGVRQSMGAVGTSADNALAESFNATLKREVLRDRKLIESPISCRQEVFRWCMGYNTRRCHSWCNLVAPDVFEAETSATLTKAALRLPSFSGHPISTDPVSVGEDVHCEFVKEEVHPGVPA